MASISHDRTNGTRTIQFVGPDRRRRTIRLGKASQRVAEGVRTRVESLLSCLLARVPLDADTSAWLAGVGDALRAKLEGVGLVSPRLGSAGVPTVAAHLADCLSRRAGGKASTYTNLEIAARRLAAHVGGEKRLDEFTRADARDWLRRLVAEYAPATAGRTFRRGKQFFQVALERRLIAENPFAGVKSPGDTNKARQVFVTHAQALACIAQARDPAWAAVIALSRFGGVRVPSELVGMVRADVLWEAGKFRVRSPKTEAYAGRSERWTPLFPELRPHLLALVESMPAGQDRLFPAVSPQTNLGTKLARAIAAAGLDPWPRLFQNMRSSRETELAALYPITDVSAWLGNTPGVAAKHYLQPLDESFARAARSGAGALHDPVHGLRVSGCSEVQGSPDHTPDHTPIHAVKLLCDQLGALVAPRLGLERPPDRSGKPADAPPRAAESGAVSPEALADALRGLPPADRLALAAWLVRGCESGRRAA